MQRLQAIGNDNSVAVTIITVEEQIRGRLEMIRRYRGSPLQVAAYEAFHQAVRYFAIWHVPGFTQEAFEQFLALRYQRIRIGSQNLRIAAITLTNNAIPVTRHTRDFSHVPGLVIEDWSSP